VTAVRPGDAFAVYGLLRAGESGFAQLGLAEAFTPLGPCHIPGRLYDLGAYPGLTPGPGQVVGELFEVFDASVITRLDAFEDYWPDDPGRTRYGRRKMQLIQPARTAWVYVWVLGLDQARLLPGGDWFKR